MEGIGSEVSQKIRAAIKAKLIELGAYVDDELPDYIMVMVANKRTKSQMDEDLQLFLTSNTKVFTSWLHTVLQKLQEVTVASFENKKDLEEKKTAKHKKSETIYNLKSRKSSEECLGRLKKHGKKHKDNKKAKKTKHKSKEKNRIKSEKKEKSEVKEKLVKKGNSLKLDQSSEETSKKLDAEKIVKKNSTILDEDIEKLKQNNLPHQDKINFFSGDSSNENSSNISNKSKPEKETGTVMKPDIIDTKKSVIEDEFNIEPLQPNEKIVELDFQKEYLQQSPIHLEPRSAEVEVEKTISAPTEELLKEHNKIQNQKLEEEKNEQKKLRSDSEDSVSPEEMRKQLLLSTAKKKLEHSKIADRMRSNSPDVLILEETNKIIDKDRDFCPSSRFDSFKQSDFRSSKSPPFHSGNLSKNSSLKKSPNQRFSPLSFSSDMRKSYSPKKLTNVKANKDEKLKSNKQKISNNEDVKMVSSIKLDGKDEKRKASEVAEKKKHIIKISENLEMEKNLGIKKESNSSKTSQKEYSSKKKSVLSRVVTITGPEAPEISSIVKVKPREYISKDKQANKALILKAVAEAQKSIATVPSRPEPEKETKKEALFTKNLRQKHFEKLAVTLSNIRKSPDSRERRVSVDSEKSDKYKNNFDDLEIVAEGDRNKSSKNMSKSEDQFISSKTTILEKNDKYIRCWLEDVQKAVIDEEMVNPQELEDLIIHSNFTDEDNELVEEEISRGIQCRKRKLENSEDTFPDKISKNAKLSDKEIANLRVIPSSTLKNDGPQIVVTLDGLDTKTIKDIILRNKEAKNGPILSSARKSIDKEKVTKITQKILSSSKDKLPSDSKKLSFQKISDRFARLNKSKEKTDSEREKDETKLLKYQSSDKEKKFKVSTESKNRLLIAQLSEKFGKVDREFENKKRKYSEDDRQYIYRSRKIEKEDIERNGKCKKSEKRSGRKDSLSPISSKFCASLSSQFCKFYPNCKNSDCLYFHPKKCRFDEDCKNPDCKYVHSQSYTRKSKWYSKS